MNNTATLTEAGTMEIRNYTTGEYIREATTEEAETYTEMLERMSAGERESGAVKGDTISDDLDGATIYMI